MIRGVRRQIARALSPLTLVALKTYARITGQQRARALVFNREGELMLVWETVGAGRWSLPGGGIKRGEAPVAAAARELREETGIVVGADQLQTIGFFKTVDTHIGYDAHMFTVTIDKALLPSRLHNPVEIIEIAWFSQDKLPEKLSPLIRPSLDKLHDERLATGSKN